MTANDPQVFLDLVQVSLQRVRDGLGCCNDDLDGLLIRLDAIFQCLMWVEPVFLPSTNFSNLLSAVADMIGHVQSAIWNQNLRGRGRPSLNISERALSSLLEQEFTQIEIAQIFGCSAKTIHRRIVEFRLSRLIQYTEISDGELDALVRNFVSNFPTAGWTPQYTGLPHTAL